MDFFKNFINNKKEKKFENSILSSFQKDLEVILFDFAFGIYINYHHIDME
jgi:hypothetical protein